MVMQREYFRKTGRYPFLISLSVSVDVKHHVYLLLTGRVAYDAILHVHPSHKRHREISKHFYEFTSAVTCNKMKSECTRQ